VERLLSPPGYRTILALGLLAAVALVVWRARRRGFAPLPVLDAALAAAAGGLLVGRAAYVALNWAYFRHHVPEAFQVWRGGLMAPGVVAGAIAGVAFFNRRRGDSLPLLLDLLAPGGAVVALSAWLGCLIAGCAWGIEVWPDQPLLWPLRAELADLYSLRVPRLPVQALGMVWNGLLLAGLGRAERPGRVFPLWLVAHAAGEVGLGFLRGDGVPLVGPLSAYQMGYLLLALAGLAGIIFRQRSNDRSDADQSG
jgi:phosphatidylglycerol:prolipoprotein diacylglycerol transferase